MPRFGHRHQDDSTSDALVFAIGGALIGFAAGIVVAQRVGGINTLVDKVRDRFAPGEEAGEYEEYDDYEDELDEDEAPVALSAADELEERVLDAFQNDPILCERGIDIGTVSDGVVELSGWVRSGGEATHAVTIARGTPGVATVVNRLMVEPQAAQQATNASRHAGGDATPTESHWEGSQIPRAATHNEIRGEGASATDETRAAPMQPPGRPDHVAEPGQQRAD